MQVIVVLDSYSVFEFVSIRLDEAVYRTTAKTVYKNCDDPQNQTCSKVNTNLKISLSFVSHWDKSRKICD